MPILTDDMDRHDIAGSNYGFSAKRIDTLGATEYTLGLLLVDVSASVSPHQKSIEKTVREVVRACRHNPRADNMMLRLVLFNRSLDEVHGFKPLSECNEDDYGGCIRTGGCTALYDAVHNAVQSVTSYAVALNNQDYDVNAALFVLTDGADNHSTATRGMVADALRQATRTEAVESLTSVLIGLNTGTDGLNDYLRAFKDDVGFSQYVAVDRASESQLARVGGFVSRSISVQSQALGGGGAGPALTF